MSSADRLLLRLEAADFSYTRNHAGFTTNENFDIVMFSIHLTNRTSVWSVRVDGVRLRNDGYGIGGSGGSGDGERRWVPSGSLVRFRVRLISIGSYPTKVCVCVV